MTTNQQVLALLSDGTGGFTIFNTNDLVGGLDRISKEGNEFYILGYVPKDSPEGSCHTLKVKMNHGGLNVRSRSGYCNARPEDVLAGKPVEKQLEARAAARGKPARFTEISSRPISTRVPTSRASTWRWKFPPTR